MKFIKKCSLLFFLIGAITNVTVAQCVVNTTTTDWQQFNGGVGPSNNDFNWTITGLTYPIYLQDNLDNPSRNIELPYFCTQSSGSGSCGNKNTLQYELLGNSASQQDINPEDGWELVLKNFGTANITPNDNTGRGVANPFFVLYNRFNGKMKIYMALMGIRTGSSALLRVGFLNGEKYTALFSHAEPITKPFGSFDNTKKFNTINHIAQKNFQDDYYWLVSELQTSYDPCACFRPIGSSKPSIIVVTPYVIQTSDIDATIEGTVSQKLIQNNTVQPESDKKTSFSELLKAGQSSYNKWNSYKSKVDEVLNNYNQKYKDKLVNDWWNEEIKKNPAIAGVYTTAQIQQQFNDFKSTSEGFKKLVGIDKIDKYNNDVSVFKGIASTLPYVGTAIGIVEFFSQGGQKEETPAPPTVFNVNLNVNGTITSETPLTDFSFHNPGTIDPNNPSGSHLTPIYDNVLGVFNALKEPTFNHHKIEPVVYLDNPYANQTIYNFPDDDWNKAEAAPLHQYFITEDFKFSINPAANLEAEVIDACYVLEYDANDDLSLHDPEEYTSTKAIPFHDLAYFSSTEKTFDERIESYERAGMHLEYVSNNYPNTGSVIRFRTPYVPLKCLPNVNFVMFGGGGKPKMYIKLLVSMKRTDDPNASNVREIITFDVSSNFNNSTELVSSSTYDAHLYAGQTLQSHVPPSTYNDVRYNFLKHNGLPLDNVYHSFHDVTYDPNIHAGNLNATGDITIPNYTNIPDGTIIRAFGKIIVGGSVTFGNNVELRAGVTIDIPPTTNINPTTALIIEPNISLSAFNCTSSDVASLKATQSEIDAICNSTTYKQNSGQAKNDPNEFENQNISEKYVLDCHFYPNPATSKVYVNLKLDNKADYKVQVMDVNGKTLVTNNYHGRKGSNIEGIEISHLPAGVYFISINTSNYFKTDKFLIIK